MPRALGEATPISSLAHPPSERLAHPTTRYGRCRIASRALATPAPPAPPPLNSRLLPAALYDLSQLLETGLDRETLAVLIGLTEQGVNPEV